MNIQHYLQETLLLAKFLNIRPTFCDTGRKSSNILVGFPGGLLIQYTSQHLLNNKYPINLCISISSIVKQELTHLFKFFQKWVLKLIYVPLWLRNSTWYLLTQHFEQIYHMTLLYSPFLCPYSQSLHFHLYPFLLPFCFLNFRMKYRYNIVV